MKTHNFELRGGKNILSKNEDGIDIFFLGVGGAFSGQFNQTNFLIIKKDAHILVDAGMNAPQALATVAGLDISDVRLILPTHSHADHIGGLEVMALMNRYVGRRIMKHPKLKMIITADYQRALWDNSLRGGLGYNESDEEAGKWMKLGDYFDFIRPVWKANQPREIFEVNVDGLRFDMFRTKHIPEHSPTWETCFYSFGLYIKGKENVFISGDTRFDRDLIEYYADRSDVMFHDAQFFTGGVHASLEELKTLPEEIKKKMFLVHYGDNWREQEIDDFAGFAQQGLIYSFD